MRHCRECLGLAIAFVLLITAAAKLSAQRFHVVLTTEQKKHVLDGDFAAKNHIASLPDAVKNSLAQVFEEKSLQMADPGKPFQETDVIVVRKLPLRRLLFGGISNEKCFIYYERGGYAHTVSLIVFQISGAGSAMQAKPIWAGADSVGKAAENLQELRSRISANQVKDDLLYYW